VRVHAQQFVTVPALCVYIQTRLGSYSTYNTRTTHVHVPCAYTQDPESTLQLPRNTWEALAHTHTQLQTYKHTNPHTPTHTHNHTCTPATQEHLRGTSIHNYRHLPIQIHTHQHTHMHTHADIYTHATHTYNACVHPGPWAHHARP